MAIKLGTFEDMVREKPLDLTKDGQCSNCGSCCSNMLPLSDSEVKRIKHYIRQHKIEPRKHLVPLAKKTIDMTCPFMELGKAEMDRIVDLIYKRGKEKANEVQD